MLMRLLCMIGRGVPSRIAVMVARRSSSVFSGRCRKILMTRKAREQCLIFEKKQEATGDREQGAGGRSRGSAHTHH